MSEKRTLTIDGKDYDFNSLSDAAKNNLANLRMADQEIARLRTQLALAETARRVFAKGIAANLPAEDVQAEWLDGRSKVGLTAGASAPDVLVQAVISRLRELGATTVRTLPGVEEHVRFPLPMGLGDKSMAEVTSGRS